MCEEPIYTSDTMRLSEIIDALGGGKEDGAIFLIPDLQRGFVWTPEKMIALLDTMLKGWPFGHIILAKTGSHALAFSPRPFYRQVFCSLRQQENEKINQPFQRDPLESDKFSLILDGQQRLQSILLCLGNADGVIMTEKDWLDIYGNTRKRKPDNSCAPAIVGINIKNLSEQYRENNNCIEKIDFQMKAKNPVFEWVLREAAPHSNNWHWWDELPSTFDKLQGAVIPLSKLWNLCKDKPDRDSLTEKFRLGEDDYAVDALLAFGQKLYSLHSLSIPIMVIQYSSAEDDEDGQQANEMLLNIFTRLNAGGVKLTKEDITLSWLKRHWIKSTDLNHNLDAQVCINSILQKMRDHYALTITTNDFVFQLSLIWSCFENGGRQITNQDLLDGNILRNAAVWLSSNWNIINDELINLADMLKRRGLIYSRQYGSLRMISLLSTWIIIGRLWFKKNTADARANIQAGNNDIFIGKLGEELDRFVFSGQWSESWNNPALYVGLSNLHKKLEDCHDSAAARQMLLDHLESMIQTMKGKAIKVVESLNVTQRNAVSRYKNFLWVWHRLDNKRAKYSILLARGITDTQEGIPHVDHCIAHNYWENVFLPQHNIHGWTEDFNKALEQINQIGNCNIIVDALNISKKDKSGKAMADFLVKVIGDKDFDDCLSALQIDRKMIYPENASSMEELLEIIAQRSQRIKDELIEFLNTAGITRYIDENVSPRGNP